MLPFTTYNIPEPDKKKTDSHGTWLWVALSEAPQHAEEELLKKICEALKATMDKDVRIMPTPNPEEISYSKSSAGPLKLMMSFGIPPSNLNLWIDMPGYGIRFLENFTFIYAHSLKELNQSPVAKKNLWRSMQVFMEQQKSS